MASTTAAKQALSSGEWREAKDNSGKTYFFNRRLNRTVWDLDKELSSAPSTTQQAPSSATPTSTTSASSPARGPPTSASQSVKEDFAALAKNLIASGVWQMKQTSTGGVPATFYQHVETGETTRDLVLCLEIQAAIKGGGSSASGGGGGVSANPIGTSSSPATVANQEVRSKHGGLMDARDLLGGVDNWVTLFLAREKGGEHEVAARHLLKQILERTGQWDAWQHSLQRSVELEAQVGRLQQDIAAQKTRMAAQDEELDMLRKMLYFGVQGVTLGATSAAVTRLPQVPTDLLAGRGVGTTTGALDPRQKPSSAASAAGNVQQERIKMLEQLVVTLQEKNRTLGVELHEAHRGNHQAAGCSMCATIDPWRRLMDGTIGSTSTQSSEHRLDGLGVSYPRPGVPTSLLHLGNDSRSHLRGTTSLPAHLTSPTIRKPAGTTTPHAAATYATTPPQQQQHPLLPPDVSLQYLPSPYPAVLAAKMYNKGTNHGAMHNALLPMSDALNIQR